VRICDCETAPGTLAVVIIAGPNRLDSCLPEVVRSAEEQDPDELLIVGDRVKTYGGRIRTLNVEPLTRSTIDALVKRDVGFVATTSANICYLADDHRLGPDFIKTFRARYVDREWDLLAPARFTTRDQSVYSLNVGKDLSYIGGHCGIYRRSILRKVPWSSSRHHPNWDVWHSHDLVKAGGKLVYADIDLAVDDIEPGAKPWM
jgi:hypothetical protein